MAGAIITGTQARRYYESTIVLAEARRSSKRSLSTMAYAVETSARFYKPRRVLLSGEARLRRKAARSLYLLLAFRVSTST